MLSRAELFGSVGWRVLWQGTLAGALLTAGYLGAMWIWATITHPGVGSSLIGGWLLVLWVLAIYAGWGALFGGIISLANALAAATLTAVYFYPPREYPARERWQYVGAMLFTTLTVTFFVMRALWTHTILANPNFDHFGFPVTLTALLATLMLTWRQAHGVLDEWRWPPQHTRHATARARSLPMPTSDDFADIPASRSRTRG